MDDPTFEEVPAPARADGAGVPGKSSRAAPLRTPARAGRWVPVVAIAGLALLIVGSGLLGPKATAPGGVDGVTPSPGASARPATTPSAAGSPGDGTPVPGLRLTGALPDDPLLLLGGRWVDLATGTPAAATDCELERPLVLVGGRIICVTRHVTRPPGSKLATYDLGVVTLGRSRTAPARGLANPSPGLLDVVRPENPLVTLVGRRDLVIGDPVAIAPVPGGEPDSLLMGWAILDGGTYRVGLDRFHIGDTGAAITGSREVLALPVESDMRPSSLADLAVSVSPDGSKALVGVTIIGAPSTTPERRLAVLRVDAGAVDGDAIGPATTIPGEVTSNVAGPAAIARDRGAACGGALGEGWATNDVLFVVCPGRPPVFRRVALSPALAGGIHDPAGRPISAAILDEIAFSPASRADARWLAGNGVAIDRLRGRYYRWSPWTGILWAIDLRAAAGSGRAVASIRLESTGSTGITSNVPLDLDPAARPMMALDPAADRLYLLAPGADGRGARIEAVSGADLAWRGRYSTAPEPFAVVALSPDGTLLYVATPPRPIAGAPGPRVAVEVLDTDPLAERLYAGRLPPAPWDAGQPLVVR